VTVNGNGSGDVDLASRTLGGSVVAASDESFGFKECLVDAKEPAFVPGTYDFRGEVVDGWETRRHAGRDGDWAIVRLGVPGRLHTVDVDTRFFSGNHPTGCRIDACVLDLTSDPTASGVSWTPLVNHTVLKPDSHNLLAVDDHRRWTHLRLRLDSDGGVARLRAYGTVIPDPDLWEDVTVEVSGVEHGGRVEWCSDSFYSHACALIAPDRPRNMGDGWETRRRRDIGPETHDAVMISFAVPADLRRLEIDTSCFVFNASTEVSVLGSRDCPDGERSWALVPFDVPVLARMRLAPDARQVFAIDVRGVTALRVQAFPDGGIARVRALGTPTESGAAQLRRQWDASTEARP
jgi:allantoicase